MTELLQVMLDWGVRLAENDFGSVFGSVLQKLRILVRFWFYKINHSFGFFALCVV